ncbi:MAG: hypothetical protein JJT94_04505 [Bernardetiaceae bacterium]|nr:hypothetical protein [Bernardetiaceae bacterium]
MPVLERHIGLSERTNIQTYEALKHYLYAHVLKLLKNNFEQLCQLLYRIDVSEKHLAEAMQLPTLELIAEKLTLKILEREYQKYRSREKYRKENN